MASDRGEVRGTPRRGSPAGPGAAPQRGSRGRAPGRFPTLPAISALALGENPTRVSPEPPSQDIILRTTDLTRHFGGLHAVEGVDLAVRRGTLTAIIGPNGAGKSTFFNLLAGALRPTRGRVELEGEDVTRMPAYRRARRGLVRTFQLTRALARMTVRENLMLAPDGQLGEHVWGPLFAAPRVHAEEVALSEKADSMLDLFELRRLADAYAGSLSGGQKKLLELARALMRDPTIVLMDEPMAGVNPTLARKLLDRVEELRRDRGITFVLVEHNLEAVFERCDPIVVMANGKKIVEGDAATVRAHPLVIEAYLGGAAEGTA